MSFFAEMSERLRLDPREERLFSGWFSDLLQRSGSGSARISGGVAASFLKASGLPNDALKQVLPECGGALRV